MRNADPLAEYRRKRDPSRSPEPMGGARRRSARRRFVIQKHQARRLHYDLRLEIDGVLKSWAVPKGPSVHPGVKRLAVQVEDHPLDYAGFEGRIPPGSYGAGPVIVWDRGTYRLVGPKPVARQLADGHLELELRGRKLRGGWVLVRTGRDRASGRSWLLVKRADAYAGGPEPVETRPESVLSSATLEDPGGAATAQSGGPRRAARAARLGDRRLPRARLAPADLPLMHPTPAATPPRGAGWVYEIKWDGVRVLILRVGGVVTLWSRTGVEQTARYPEVVAAAARLGGGDLALDAEIVAADASGRPSFHALQRRMHRDGRVGDAIVATTPVTAYAYDCLALEGRDLRRLPLAERKALLAGIVGADGPLRYCEHLAGDGAAILAATAAMGLEGVVAKRLDAPYHGGRRREWLKLKTTRRQELVVGGFTEPKGTRADLGALHVGFYDGRDLVYAGRVGSGLTAGVLRQLRAGLGAIRTDRCPFTRGDPPRGREHHWVRPLLVCEVRFTEWTPDGHLRHPVFLGLRADRPPRRVRREEPCTPPAGAPERRTARRGTSVATAPARDRPPRAPRGAAARVAPSPSRPVTRGARRRTPARGGGTAPPRRPPRPRSGG